MNYVEVVLKITDNGAPVKKGLNIVYLTYLLPVNNNLPMHFFGLNCNIIYHDKRITSLLLQVMKR